MFTYLFDNLSIRYLNWTYVISEDLSTENRVSAGLRGSSEVRHQIVLKNLTVILFLVSSVLIVVAGIEHLRVELVEGTFEVSDIALLF